VLPSFVAPHRAAAGRCGRLRAIVPAVDPFEHDPLQADRPPRFARFLAALSGTSVAVAVALGVVAAILLNPVFALPFTVVLGRTLFLAMVLLLVFAAARQWQPRRLPEWMPDWLLPVVVVGLTAPLAVALVYVLAVGGNVLDFVFSPQRVRGYLWLSAITLIMGLVLALVAVARERLAQVRARELKVELERSRLDKQSVDARLSLLQAQIEPHFLFNTLANVQALVEAGSPRAGPVLQSLIAYLRAAMPRLHAGQPTLESEIALVRAYLQLMQMRMPDRLQFEVGLPTALLGLRFPPMGLLTLVENAVRHGIDPSEEGGRIEVGGEPLPGGGARLWVSDSGVGMTETATPGLGLANLRDRLAALHGQAARLTLSEVVPRGVRAEIDLPAGRPDEGST
jgi:signal transduction histidine kinase